MVDDALRFGALYAYHTHGDWSERERMREGTWVRVNVKQDRPLRADSPPPSRRIAHRVLDDADPRVFDGVVRSADWLVPVPSSAPRPPDALWVPHRIALAIVEGLGSASVVACLVRRHSIKRVPRARLRAERPTITEHVNSLAFEGPRIPVPSSIVLVDDVVTSGTTALACARVLRAHLGSGVPIFLLAAVRAISASRPADHQFFSP